MGSRNKMRSCMGICIAFVCTVAASVVFAERIELKAGASSCTVETVGARILSYRTPVGGEVLWNADPVQTEDEKWAHGGIPVCWPWFEVNEKGEFHGTAWRDEFKVASRSCEEGRDELVLVREEGKVRVTCAIVLGTTLRVELKTVNGSEKDFAFSAGLHPYFRVGERDKTEVTGLGPKPLVITRTIDDVFPAGPCAFAVYGLQDRSLGRTIFLLFENATGVNVWNLGPEKDCPGTVPGDEWRHWVCVEPMLGSYKRPVTVRAGCSMTLAMSVDVRKK